MSLTHTFILRPRRGSPGEAATAPTSRAQAPSAEVARILDDLVDAIDIRESFELEVSGWSTEHTIRRLERELARVWSSEPRPFDPPFAARPWQP